VNIDPKGTNVYTHHFGYLDLKPIPDDTPVLEVIEATLTFTKDGAVINGVGRWINLPPDEGDAGGEQEQAQ
jgi:hypothetical protein